MTSNRMVTECETAWEVRGREEEMWWLWNLEIGIVVFGAARADPLKTPNVA